MIGRGRLLAAGAAIALTGFAGWGIVTAPTPAGGPAGPVPWIQLAENGFRVQLPAIPSPPATAGAAHFIAASANERSYVVAWFRVATGVAPGAVVSDALAGLPAAGAVLMSSTSGHVGPFASADITARLPQEYLFGRVLVVATRGYLVAELGPGQLAPPDLERLLGGFDPDPTTVSGP